MRALAGAVGFLTRIPVPTPGAAAQPQLAGGAPWFPVVGAAVGALAGLAAWLLHPVLPAPAAGALAVGLGVVVTGALHLDGLADVADALGGRTREQALAIMRDHAIGTYGAAALAIDLIVKAGVVAALAGSGQVVAELAVAGAASRACAPLLAWALPPARPAGGLGTAFAKGVTRRGAAASVAAAAVIAFAALGADGLVVACGVILVAVALGAWYRRRFGGVTGDMLGAGVELTETLGLLLAAGLAGTRP